MIQYSVVIPTYNRAELLKQCLDALARQTVPRSSYEVIVVNDGSRDHTDAVMKEFISTHPEMSIVYLPQQNAGPAKARNRGIRRARGEFVFFTDDDCVVPDTWIETLADGYRRHPEVAGVGGWYEYPEKIYTTNPFARYYTDWMHKRYGARMENEEIKTKNFIQNPAGNTSNMSYRKKILEEIGGFDPTITFPGFDDLELKKRIMDAGHQLLYIPHQVSHSRPLGPRAIAERCFNFGRGRYHFTKKNQELRNFYYPSLRTMKVKYGATRGFLPRLMVLIEFIFSRLGWEYQKFIEK
ncbi:MAG: hypothetical protein A3C07_00840 [Candidatus Sungbacteria bacterium RIFCSPHIGHO2_02_FULL_47_11]|uniref:Glycosyltransferase 2-like domain-containing protein n=1 Tax=Candidatus Sungbacteria bacterium RIFCSPHIGHO2_02_FULL_47_11 TaxID=1802270 RepID=A0A1G2KNF1_9BACT|nr:MAG: hypothetical protein A3C07_00840 [Candidatus Sungbacteria bacterium RIFCSPHIGHO2_02_FULL_47_11]